MENSLYAYNKFFLTFRDEIVENDYKNYIFNRTKIFCRIAWGLVIFLGASFAYLDKPMFGDLSGTVLLVRFTFLTFAALIIFATFRNRLIKYMDWSSALLITSGGFFCIFQTAIGDPAVFNPYFTGIFYAFTGIFTTAGMGFRYSIMALLLNLIVFEILFGIIVPIAPDLFLIYNFFLPGFLILFAYIGYLVERFSRDNYIVSAKLKDSLAKVKTLSGLLPICAHCKKIRDDKGYWNQIDQFIHEHTEAEFSHSICPDCTDDLFNGIDTKEN